MSVCLYVYVCVCVCIYVYIYICYIYLHLYIYFKDLAYMIVEIGKSEICRIGQQAGNF